MFRIARRPLRLFRAGATVVAATAVALVPLNVLPAAQATTVDTYFTMVGGGDYIGGSTSQLFHPGNATVTVSGTSRVLMVRVEGGTLGKYFSLEMAAPQGQTLVPGAYEGAQRYPFQSSSLPGLDVSGDGRGCNQVTGRFVVYDMAVGENGVINRFLASYEHHCEGGVAALVGQISINQPATSDVLLAGSKLDWGSSYPGVNGRTMPVWLVNRGVAARTFGAPAITGTNAADFKVVSNGCATLAAGATCALHLGFKAGGAGPREAAFSIGDSSQDTHTASLTGTGIAGHTAFYMRSDQGDYIGGGQAYNYTPANATLSASGTTGYFSMGVSSGSAWWSAELKAASGGLLMPGTYENATRASFSGGGVGLDVSGSGRGCNTLTGSFTVIEAVYRDGTGPMEKFSATFEQHCEGGAPALHGWLSWRATDPNVPNDVPPPPDPDNPSDPLPVTNLEAYPDLGSTVLTWTKPAGAFTEIVVRGMQGLTAPQSPAAGGLVYQGTGTGVYVGYLTPGASYAFSVWVRYGTEWAPPNTIAVRGTGLSLTANPGLVTYGGVATVTARLVDAPTKAALAGMDVDLYYRKPGAVEFTWYGTRTTNANGAVSVAYKPGTTYDWQAVFYGDGMHVGVSTGPVRAGVRYNVTAALNKTSVVRNGYATISGAVGPARPGQMVYLQRYYSGGWHNVTYRALSASSTYAFTVRPGTAGKWIFRVHKSGNADVGAGYSPTRTLTVT